jgi:guanylate kinase
MDGKLIIISAPSGAGKTSIVKHLLDQNFPLAFSVSATSRPKRTNETDKKDYYFLTVEDFKKKIESGAFLEWQEVYPNQFYGTLKSEVERIWRTGHHVIFDVDVLGGLNIKKQFGERALSIFIKPPTIECLKERLASRGTENSHSLKQRMEKAEYELSFENHFDKIVINENLPDAQQEVLRLMKDFLSVPIT